MQVGSETRFFPNNLVSQLTSMHDWTILNARQINERSMRDRPLSRLLIEEKWR